jgi:hypothetical protein
VHCSPQACNGRIHRAVPTQILAKYSNVRDAALIDRIDWGAADPQGCIAEASVMDVQATLLKENLTRDKVAFARIAPAGSRTSQRASGRSSRPLAAMPRAVSRR